MHYILPPQQDRPLLSSASISSLGIIIPEEFPFLLILLLIYLALLNLGSVPTADGRTMTKERFTIITVHGSVQFMV